METSTGTVTSRQHNMGRWMMVGAALLWGLAGVCVKSVTWNTFSLGASRFLATVIVLCIAKKSLRIRWTRWNVLGGLFYCMTGILYMGAIKMTTAGTAIVIQYTAPIFVFLYCLIFRKRKTSVFEILITIFVFGGVVLSFADSLDLQHLIGNLLGLASGLTYAAAILITNRPDCDSEDAVIISALIGTVFCAPMAVVNLTTIPDPFSLKNVIWVLILCFVEYALANLLFAKGIHWVESVEASLILTIEPIFNPIPVALLCGEVMGPLAIVGGAMVVVGVALHAVLSSKTNKKLKAAEEAESIAGGENDSGEE